MKEKFKKTHRQLVNLIRRQLGIGDGTVIPKKYLWIFVLLMPVRGFYYLIHNTEINRFCRYDFQYDLFIIQGVPFSRRVVCDAVDRLKEGVKYRVELEYDKKTNNIMMTILKRGE